VRINFCKIIVFEEKEKLVINDLAPFLKLKEHSAVRALSKNRIFLLNPVILIRDGDEINTSKPLWAPKTTEIDIIISQFKARPIPKIRH